MSKPSFLLSRDSNQTTWFEALLLRQYTDRAFKSCKTCLSKQVITLLCCNVNSHVPFIERAIRFVKERVRCVRSMLSKRIKCIPVRLMRKLVMSTIKMINPIRRKGGVHPVMSSRHIITGMRMKLPPYPPGSCVWGSRKIHQQFGQYEKLCSIVSPP